MAKATSNVEFRKVNVEEDQYEEQAGETSADDKFTSNVPVIQNALKAGDQTAAMKALVADYPRSNGEIRAKYRDFMVDVLGRIPKSEIEKTLGSLSKTEQENLMKFVMEVQRNPGIKGATIQSCLHVQDALMGKINMGGLMRVLVTRQK
ncbi:uncharacterized protein LOC142344343 [Convolutriloba macropyga]|uniref:uncharacterized protein LOC142344343 n=1 Tax=Convolutriloba macropyga TaxID=536237 RepID=UPI003F51D6C9